MTHNQQLAKQIDKYSSALWNFIDYNVVTYHKARHQSFILCWCWLLSSLIIFLIVHELWSNHTYFLANNRRSHLTVQTVSNFQSNDPQPLVRWTAPIVETSNSCLLKRFQRTRNKVNPHSFIRLESSRTWTSSKRQKVDFWIMKPLELNGSPTSYTKILRCIAYKCTSRSKPLKLD